MKRNSSRLEQSTPSPTPAPMAPISQGVPQQQFFPQAQAQAPVAGAPFPQGAPTTVAPVRRVVHPARVVERHSVIRYPIENIYPTHVRNVRHHVCEYFCEYPVSESTEDCQHTVDHCCPPPPYGRR
ncbi:CotD family spore coat protein [Bacillus horti]|uniref:Spore coat protein D n=1 Tax=Caldalkalibacillus horti TaxID=77523 RepID=A0ABT9VWR7_9BACI|nr:CotD family spore coat protein [Bacillus horti]MDQ0165423.1 hypothetical protein [Bacillus horti]